MIYDGVPQTFAEHSGASIVAFGKGSGKLVNVVLLRNDDAGSGALVDNLLTQYKVVNASLVPSPLNVLVDGSLQLSNIPYTGVSNYQRTSAGAHNFSFEATTTPGASLLTLVQTLAAATDTSIVLTGTAGALHRAGAAGQQPAAAGGNRQRTVRQFVRGCRGVRRVRQFQQAGFGPCDQQRFGDTSISARPPRPEPAMNSTSIWPGRRPRC